MGYYRIGSVLYDHPIARGVLAVIRPEVLNLMIEQGGNFNRKLVELYRVADSENSQRLERAFSDLFERFAVLLESQNEDDDFPPWEDLHQSFFPDDFQGIC